MSVYTLPNRRIFRPRSMSWQLLGNVAMNRSPTNGVFTTSELIGDAWAIKMDYGNDYTDTDRREQAAFFNRFRGAAHLLRVWNVAHPEPRGTMRGSPTANGDQAAGWNVITISLSTAGASLLAGDKIGTTSDNGYPLLMEVAEDASTAGFTLNVALTMPLRRRVVGGTPIVWQRPAADFLILQAPFIPLEPKVSPGFSIEAIEFVR